MSVGAAEPVYVRWSCFGVRVSLALMLVLFSSPSASACPRNERCGSDDNEQATPSAAERDPSACAQRPELVGGACSYTTSMMAKRVLAEGKRWSFTGHLTSSSLLLDSHVAAPYTVGPVPVFVIANEVFEGLVEAGIAMRRVTLEGRVLDVGGTQYLVLENYVTHGS